MGTEAGSQPSAEQGLVHQEEGERSAGSPGPSAALRASWAWRNPSYSENCEITIHFPF